MYACGVAEISELGGIRYVSSFRAATVGAEAGVLRVALRFPDAISAGSAAAATIDSLERQATMIRIVLIL